jgi:hypothetical protein
MLDFRVESDTNSHMLFVDAVMIGLVLALGEFAYQHFKLGKTAQELQT